MPETTTKAPRKNQPKAKKPAKVSNGSLSKAYLRVLGILAKSKGALTRKAIAAAVVKQGVACYNGRISNESQTYADLTSGGYAREQEIEVDGAKETVYTILAKGKTTLGK